MREKGKRLIAFILSCLLLLSNVTVYAAIEAEAQSDTQNTVSVNASEEAVTLPEEPTNGSAGEEAVVQNEPNAEDTSDETEETETLAPINETDPLEILETPKNMVGIEISSFNFLPTTRSIGIPAVGSTATGTCYTGDTWNVNYPYQDYFYVNNFTGDLTGAVTVQDFECLDPTAALPAHKNASYEAKVKYLSTTYHLFRDPYFRTLKPKQKLLVMDLLNIQMAGRPNGVNAYRIYRKNFIKKYANIKQNDGTKSKGLLDITVRTLQKYFKLLKYYFSVSLKNGMYFFTLKSKFAKSGVNHTTENHITIQHLVKAACRRNKIKDPDAKEQEKIEKVLENREKEVLNQFVNLSDIIRSMIETINEKIPDPRKWNRRLKATLFIKKFNEAVS